MVTPVNPAAISQTAESWREVIIAVAVILLVWGPVQFWVMGKIEKWWRGEK